MSDLVAVIPARGGSKGVPHKNKRRILGRPLFQYSTDFALESGCFDKVILSTDDEEILAIGARFDELTCVKRPQAFATDTATQTDVIRHLLETGKLRHEDTIVLLQPTSPFRLKEDLVAVVSLFNSYNGRLPVASVVKVEDSHPARMYMQDGDKFISIDRENFAKRRQDLPPCYLRNGSLYVRKASEAVMQGFTSDVMLSHIMPPERSVNIDVELDFKLAEAIYVSNP